MTIGAIDESQRKAAKVIPTYRLVDTCAAEFEAYTPYYYSTYGEENERRESGKRKVMILGGGPNRVGQGIGGVQDELAEAIGRRLAQLTGAEWGMIAAGSAAGLALAAAACVAGNDPERMLRLPLIETPRDVLQERPPHEHTRAEVTGVLDVDQPRLVVECRFVHDRHVPEEVVDEPERQGDGRVRHEPPRAPS